jgi:UDP-2,4-diacetamido-2,4,6-trideoxy-beta-L-altropyranose hydrolase
MHLSRSIAIRVDFNKIIGLGHINRCLNLAEVLRKKGWDVLFICRNCPEKNKINFKRFKVIFISKNLNELNDGKITRSIVIKNFISILVIDRDHYLNQKKKVNYLCFLKEIRKIKIIFAWEPFIYPNYDYNYNYHPYIGSENIVKNKNNFVSGVKYLVINKKFFFLRKINKKVKNILINLGGTNNSAALNKILKNFFFYRDSIKINVALFQKINNRNFLKIKKIIKTKKLKVNFIINSKKIHNLYKKADVGIFSSGYSKYEASASGLPIIIFQKRKTDFLFNKFFVKKKSSFLIKNLKNKNILYKVIKNFELRKKMSKNGLKILKINNNNRITSLFNDILNSNYEKISN